MKIYTKTGDDGETGLLGGERVSKNSVRIEAYGNVDELNSFLGLTLTEVKNEEVKELLKKIQNQLFVLGADLSAPVELGDRKKNILRIPPEYSSEIERSIDFFEEKLTELKEFIIPGGSKSAALLHICRTVARRAERKVVELKKLEQINHNLVIYLNRLSDLFFVLARFENKMSDIPDVKWTK